MVPSLDRGDLETPDILESNQTQEDIDMSESCSKAEIILYKGIPFRRYPDARDCTMRYYYRSSRKGIDRLHREIWKDAHGTIPAGCYIFHQDGNPLNNALESLVCSPPTEHHVWPTKEEMAQRRIGISQRQAIWTLLKHKRTQPDAWGVGAVEQAALQSIPCACCETPFQPRVE